MEKNKISALIQVFREHSPKLPPKEFLDSIGFAPEKDESNYWSGIRDANGEKRIEVSETLYRDFTIADITLIRYILGQDTLSRSKYAGADILLSAFMLFQLRQVKDVFRLYRAKSSGGMDTWIVLDPHLLFGAGIQETQDYLNTISNEEAHEILQYIKDEYLPHYAQDLEHYEKGMLQYFAPLKAN